MHPKPSNILEISLFLLYRIEVSLVGFPNLMVVFDVALCVTVLKPSPQESDLATYSPLSDFQTISEALHPKF